MRKFIPFVIIGVILFVVVVKFHSSFTTLSTATHIIFHPGASLSVQNGYTNMVLLGIGGGSHDGPNLTDTIIFASINWKKNTVTLISIPRDLWIPTLPLSLKKANEAYNIGGIPLAEKSIQEVTGQPVNYGIRIDFQGFIDAINQIGGVDVTVKRTLDDYNYPISGKEDETCGHTPEELQAFNASISASLTPDEDNFTFFPCRYEHVHFDPGLQHMDGESSLEFARSRHANGIEGTDFARSARQQLIIEAVRNKLISSALFSPQKLTGLYSIIKNSIDTDINDSTLGLFLDKLPQLKSAKIVNVNVDEGDYTTGRAGLLVNAPVTSAYDFSAALIPRMGEGDFSEIQDYISCELTKGNCIVPDVSQAPTPSLSIVKNK